MNIKKIFLYVATISIFLFGIGYFSLKTPSNENVIYSYMKNNENEVISINNVNAIITLLKKTKDVKNIENIQLGSRFIKKILIIKKENDNIYNFKDDIFLVETKVSNRVIKYFFGKNNKIQKISDYMYSLNEKNDLYYLLIDEGNILISKDKIYIENLVKNKQENRNKELVERIKSYDDKTIASIMIGKNDEMFLKKYIGSVEKSENYINIDGDKIEFSFNLYPSVEELSKFRRDYFSNDGEDKLYGDKIYLRNNLYVRTTNSNIGLISYIFPKLKVNDKGESNKNNSESIEVNIEKNEFLYGDFTLKDGINFETQGYLGDKSIELKIVTDEKTFITFYNEGKDFNFKKITKQIGF